MVIGAAKAVLGSVLSREISKASLELHRLIVELELAWEISIVGIGAAEPLLWCLSRLLVFEIGSATVLLSFFFPEAEDSVVGEDRGEFSRDTPDGGSSVSTKCLSDVVGDIGNNGLVTVEVRRLLSLRADRGRSSTLSAIDEKKMIQCAAI